MTRPGRDETGLRPAMTAWAEVDPQSPSCAGLNDVSFDHAMARMKGGWVYIMANRRNGVLYVGVTADLAKRAWQHRQGLAEGFTDRYGVTRLVWYGRHERIEDAIQREKISSTGRVNGRSTSSRA